MANVDPTFEEQILDVPQQQRKTHTHQHADADELR